MFSIALNLSDAAPFGYRFLVAHHLEQGSLIELLPEFSGASRPFSLVYPSKRHLPQRVRVLIDFFIATFGLVDGFRPARRL
jgi:DNA-binding transcriptional LysR family regulator